MNEVQGSGIMHQLAVEGPGVSRRCAAFRVPFRQASPPHRRVAVWGIETTTIPRGRVGQQHSSPTTTMSYLRSVAARRALDQTFLPTTT